MNLVAPGVCPVNGAAVRHLTRLVRASSDARVPDEAAAALAAWLEPAVTFLVFTEACHVSGRDVDQSFINLSPCLLLSPHSNEFGS